MDSKKVNRRAITSAYLLLTENCNLRCTYCFEGNTRCVNNYMSKETAFKTVDFLLQQAIDNNVDEIKLTFFGGEPMLCPDLMMDIMRYTEDKVAANGKTARYGIITNGTIFNEKTEEFLDTWRELKGKDAIDIQLSIDGIPEIQNKNRPCAAEGVLSSKLVEDAVAKFKEYYKKYDVPRDKLHIHAVVSKQSLPRIYDSFRYFTGVLEIRNANFAWVIEDNWDDKDLDIFSEQLGLIVNDLSKITTNEKRFPFKHNDKSWGCSSGQNLVAVDTQGNIYPCHRFFFFSIDKRKDSILGYVGTGITHPKRREQYFDIDYSKISQDPCQICIATNYSCTGDCHKLPNDYGAKFMNIINQYYYHFLGLIEKRTQVDLINELAIMVKEQQKQIAGLEKRVKELEKGPRIT